MITVTVTTSLLHRREWESDEPLSHPREALGSCLDAEEGEQHRDGASLAFSSPSASGSSIHTGAWNVDGNEGMASLELHSESVANTVVPTASKSVKKRSRKAIASGDGENSGDPLSTEVDVSGMGAAGAEMAMERKGKEKGKRRQVPRTAVKGKRSLRAKAKKRRKVDKSAELASQPLPPGPQRSQVRLRFRTRQCAHFAVLELMR